MTQKQSHNQPLTHNMNIPHSAKETANGPSKVDVIDQVSQELRGNFETLFSEQSAQAEARAEARENALADRLETLFTAQAKISEAREEARTSALETKIQTLEAALDKVNDLTDAQKEAVSKHVSVYREEVQKEAEKSREQHKADMKELDGSIRGAFESRFSELEKGMAALSEDQKKALDDIIHRMTGHEAVMRDPAKLRALLASDRNWLGKKNQAWFQEGAIGHVTQGRDFLRNSPIGAVLETGAWTMAGIKLVEVISAFLFGGADDAVEAALK